MIKKLLLILSLLLLITILYNPFNKAYSKDDIVYKNGRDSLNSTEAFLIAEIVNNVTVDIFNFFPEEEKDGYIPYIACKGVLLKGNKVLTAEHCIKDIKNIAIVYNKKYYKPKSLITNSKLELSLLDLSVNNLPYINFTKFDNKDILVLLDQNLDISIGKYIPYKKHYQTLIPTDLKSDKGDSGSAILNSDGELVGILQAINIKYGKYYYQDSTLITPINKEVIQFINRKD